MPYLQHDCRSFYPTRSHTYNVTVDGGCRQERLNELSQPCIVFDPSASTVTQSESPGPII
jgi:hypothetical protein